MKIYYTCEYCGRPIAELEVDRVDEERFGFDCLTDEERQDIIKINERDNTMQVQSLCDDCIIALGVTEDFYYAKKVRFLH